MVQASLSVPPKSRLTAFGEYVRVQDTCRKFPLDRILAHHSTLEYAVSWWQFLTNIEAPLGAQEGTSVRDV